MFNGWLQRGIIGIAIAILAVQWTTALRNPRGDFMLHHEFGRRLRTGETLYVGGMHLPYPPAWAVPHVPLSMLEPGVAKAAFFLIGVAALLGLLWLLQDLTKDLVPLRTGQSFWVLAAAIFIAGRFINRDFDDGGQNTVFLFLTLLTIWLAVRDRPLLGGVSLGAAIALKCTAGLFLVYFLLKRQWKLAASSAACSFAFFLTPMFWQGPSDFAFHVNYWYLNLAWRGTDPDPSRGALGAEVLQNKSLRPSLARYLMTLPPGHPGRHYVDDLKEGDPNRTPHPWSLDFLDLRPELAGMIIKGLMLVALVFVAVWRRQPYDASDRLTYLWETSIVGVVMLLYSPLTWGQHCVALLPAFYLLIRVSASGRLEGRGWIAFLIGFAILTIGANRTFIGRDLSLLVESYHPLTFAMVALVVVMFAAIGKIRGNVAIADPATETPTEPASAKRQAA